MGGAPIGWEGHGGADEIGMVWRGLVRAHGVIMDLLIHIARLGRVVLWFVVVGGH